MEPAIYRITLNVNRSATLVSLGAQKGDTARRLVVNLVENGRPYHIAEGCYAVLSGKKSDGTPLFNDCVVDGNTIIYDFTPQTVNVVGRVKCELRLYGSDNRQLTSTDFEIIVHDRAISEQDDIESTPEFSALDRLVSQAAETTEAAVKVTNVAAQNANAAAENVNKIANDLIAAKERGEFVDIHVCTSSEFKSLKESYSLLTGDTYIIAEMVPTMGEYNGEYKNGDVIYVKEAGYVEGGVAYPGFLIRRGNLSDRIDAVLCKKQSLTPEQQAQARENVGAADKETASQGRNAKYTFSTGGWKRILNVIRASNGEVDLGLVCNYPYRSTQILAFDMTGYVKYPDQKNGAQGDTTDSKPVLVKRYENSFGIKGTAENPQAKITKVRIGYPAHGESPEGDVYNPINCYVDIYVDVDESKVIEGHALPDFNMNYAGFADSHNCEAVVEETDATDTGMYGETLTFYEVNVADMNGYMTRESINRGGLYPHYGLAFTGGGKGVDLRVVPATNAQIDAASTGCYNPITPGNLKYAVQKYAKAAYPPRVVIPGDIGYSLEETIEIMIDRGERGDYQGQILVFDGEGSEDEFGAAIYLGVSYGKPVWKRITVCMQELIDDVIAKLPIYNGEVETV